MRFVSFQTYRIHIVPLDAMCFATTAGLNQWWCEELTIAITLQTSLPVALNG